MLSIWKVPFVSGGALAALIATSLSLAHLEADATASPTTSIDATATPPWPNNIPLDVEKSDPHLVLVDAFQVAGLEENEATEKVDEIFDEVFGSGDEPRLDWQRSSPHLVIYDAFIAADYSEEVAVELASMAMRTFHGKSAIPTGEALQGLEECHVYRITIIWCDGAGEQRRIRRYIGKNCWDNLISTCGLTNATCAVGQKVVYTFSLAPGCIDGVSGCVWIDRGSLTWVDCEHANILDCECIEDCEDAGYTCCDVLDGCDGCPCDE